MSTLYIIQTFRQQYSFLAAILNFFLFFDIEGCVYFYVKLISISISFLYKAFEKCTPTINPAASKRANKSFIMKSKILKMHLNNNFVQNYVIWLLVTVLKKTISCVYHLSNIARPAFNANADGTSFFTNLYLTHYF